MNSIRFFLYAFLASCLLLAPGTVFSQEKKDTPPLRLGRLAATEGEVLLKRVDGETFEAAPINFPLRAGDELKTGPNGLAEVTADDGSRLRLGNGTNLLIAELHSAFDSDTITIRLALTQGDAYFLPAKPNAGSLFIIETPAATVNVHSTSLFRTSVEASGLTRVWLERGSIEVAGGIGRINLSEGQGAEIRPGEPPHPLTANPPGDLLAQWNIQREGLYSPADTGDQYMPQEIPMGRQDLSRNGVWLYDAQYGYIWKPTVPSEWRPYTAGSWYYLEPFGWTWVGSEPWGWVPYHYGSWVWVWSNGWVWVPGRRWGPAWVVWNRTGVYATWTPVHPYDDYWYYNYYCDYAYVGWYPFYGYYYGVGWHNYWPTHYWWTVDHHYHHRHYYHYPRDHDRRHRPNLADDLTPINAPRYLNGPDLPVIQREVFDKPGTRVAPVRHETRQAGNLLEKKNWGVQSAPKWIQSDRKASVKPISQIANTRLQRTLPQDSAQSPAREQLRKEARLQTNQYRQQEVQQRQKVGKGPVKFQNREGVPHLSNQPSESIQIEKGPGGTRFNQTGKTIDIKPQQNQPEVKKPGLKGQEQRLQQAPQQQPELAPTPQSSRFQYFQQHPSQIQQQRQPIQQRQQQVQPTPLPTGGIQQPQPKQQQQKPPSGGLAPKATSPPRQQPPPRQVQPKKEVEKEEKVKKDKK